MLAMWMMHHLTHQNILFSKLGEAKNMAVEAGATGMAIFIVCMMTIPAAIKSAQFPFTSWLPRAMEGPHFVFCHFLRFAECAYRCFLITANASALGRYAVGKNCNHNYWSSNGNGGYFNCKSATNC